MITLKGSYNTAKVFTDNLEDETVSQIVNLLNQEFIKDSSIRIMPDTHAGTGCTVGTTMTITDKVVPNLVGVDIGCGMETAVLKNKNIELQRLDKIIHKYIPAGFEIREKEHKYNEDINLEELYCRDFVNIKRAKLSLGTLGGGNHFIEVNKDEEGKLYLVVHTGSRNLGKQIAEFYQNEAYEQLKSEHINKVNKDKLSIDRNLAYIEGKPLENYLHDMNIAQNYAILNRKAILNIIAKEMKLNIEDSFTTIHNYIDVDYKILRKGAISAKLGERCIIPMNMRDGSLICIGKGNSDWNYSAPHGAGRLMSRRKAKESITLSEFKKSMTGVYSTTVNKSTIDESPFAYKPMDEIIKNMEDAVDILKVIKPIYNFKAAE